MNKMNLKPWILSCIIVLVCFSFVACGNQDDGYNADEVTNSGTNTETNNDTNNGSLGQDIEDIGDDIIDGAEDLLDGNDTAAEPGMEGSTAIDNMSKENVDKRSK